MVLARQSETAISLSIINSSWVYPDAYEGVCLYMHHRQAVRIRDSIAERQDIAGQGTKPLYIVGTGIRALAGYGHRIARDAHYAVHIIDEKTITDMGHLQCKGTGRAGDNGCGVCISTIMVFAFSHGVVEVFILRPDLHTAVWVCITGPAGPAARPNSG